MTTVPVAIKRLSGLNPLQSTVISTLGVDGVMIVGGGKIIPGVGGIEVVVG